MDLSAFEKRKNRDNIILKLTFQFALDVIEFSEQIRACHRFDMSSQIFRAGTSIGANIREAQNAESRNDFIHKFKIAAKESEEILFWFELCAESPHYPTPSKKLFDRLNAIHLVINKIIVSSKTRIS